MLLILQIDAKTWGELLRDYGLPLAFLGVVLWIGVPLVKKLLETQSQQLTESRQAREVERRDFLNALKEVTTEHKEALGRLAESVDNIRDEVRRSKG